MKNHRGSASLVLVISIVVVALVAGYFAFQKSDTSQTKSFSEKVAENELNQYIDSCKNRVAGTTEENIPYFCYIEVASTQKNSDICGLIPETDKTSLGSKLDCYKKISDAARKNNSPELCKSIPNTSEALEGIQIDCYGTLAYNFGRGNLKVCRDLGDVSNFSGHSLKQSCLGKVASICATLQYYNNTEASLPRVCADVYKKQ